MNSDLLKKIKLSFRAVKVVPTTRQHRTLFVRLSKKIKITIWYPDLHSMATFFVESFFVRHVDDVFSVTNAKFMLCALLAH